MADETKQPDAPQNADDAEAAPEQRAAPAQPRADDKSPSPGAEIAGAGSLPPPPDNPTPEAPATPATQAALTGKAPSGIALPAEAVLPLRSNLKFPLITSAKAGEALLKSVKPRCFV